MPNVVELDLRRNFLAQLTYDCADTSCVPALACLDLSDNVFTEPPTALLEFRASLRWLSLKYNLLTEVTRNTFVDLRITELDLSQNRISALESDAFSLLPELTSINLESNNLTQLPNPAFDSAEKLAVVDLSDNFLGDLAPGAFASLFSLRVLDLSNNDLGAIHTQFVPGSLETLNLHDNRISAIAADAFGAGRRLRYITLDGNFLHQLPDNVFGHCRSLSALYLQGNQLTSITSDTLRGAHHTLTEVYLNDNNLLRIDDLGLPELRYLDLSFNSLTHFFLNTSRYLIALDLSDNPLEAVPDLSALVQLQLFGQRNHTIPTFDLSKFFSLRDLTGIDADAAPGSPSRVVVTSEPVSAWNLSAIEHLHVANMELPTSVLSHLINTASVNSLHIGWRGLGVTQLTNEDICSMLSAEAVELAVWSSSYTSLKVCKNVPLRKVFLEHNSEL
ncbi:hypothetical protein PTSG_13192, partial [Salpingoeca rosetta]